MPKDSKACKALDIILEEKYRPKKEQIRNNLVSGVEKITDVMEQIASEHGSALASSPIEKLKSIKSPVLEFEKHVLSKLTDPKLIDKQDITAFEKHMYDSRLKLISADRLFNTSSYESLRKMLASELYIATHKHLPAGRGHYCKDCPVVINKCVSDCKKTPPYEKFACLQLNNDRSYCCPKLDSKDLLPHPDWRKEESDDNLSTTLKHYYDDIIDKNRQELRGRLYGNGRTRLNLRNRWGLAVLRRWNSYTPAMQLSEGGGYFAFHTNEEGHIDCGIAIDPGYDFLKNFLAQKFLIDDIDAIIVTHDHPDHLDDFSAILNLKYEFMHDRPGSDSGKWRRQKITAILSEGAFLKLRPLIETSRASVIKDTKVLGPGNTYEYILESAEDKIKVAIKGKMAFHKDNSEPKCDSIGFVLTPQINGKYTELAAFPSDTKWDKRFFGKADTKNAEYAYPDCEVYCVHAGSLFPEKNNLVDYYVKEHTDRILHDKQHLYFPGTFWFCEHLDNRSHKALVVLSEFGEELKGGLRVDLALKLNSYIEVYGGNKTTFILPGDIGLTVDLESQHIRCSCCDLFYDPRDGFDFPIHGPDEAIFYVCQNCQQILTDDQRHRIFKEKQESFRLIRGRPN